jgi:hypothetical protein
VVNNLNVNDEIMGTCKVRNEIETKRNKTERNEIKRNETKPIETKRIFSKTKCNENKMKNSIWHED